jgi:hypothetical protein
MEALIGVVYESIGLDGISKWLSTLYLLPERDRVRGAGMSSCCSPYQNASADALCASTCRRLASALT